MPKKKSVKKKSRKTISSKRLVFSSKRKINLVLRNLVLFGILSLISFMLYGVSSSELYMNTFSLISMILGFISFAFLIVLLVLLALKIMKK